MPLEIQKEERESSQGLIRRFQKRVQQSGLLLRARKIRFKERMKSEQMRKRAALRREELKKQYEKLKKLGKAPK
jgi:ribosomal protein S21